MSGDEPDVVTGIAIEDVAHGGDGVGHLEDGCVVFVPRTLPGEVVDVKILERSDRYARGSVVSWRERSDDRIDPDCPYYERCGGCQFWHVPYRRELELKVEATHALIERNAGRDLPDPGVHAAPSDRRYRSRVRFHRRRDDDDGGGGWPIGFFARGSRRLVEVDDCLVAEETVNDARRQVEPGLEDVGPVELRIETADEDTAVVSIEPEERAPDEPPDSLVAFAELLGDEAAIRGVRFVEADREWVGGDASVDGDRALAEAPVETIRLPAGLFRQANPAVNRRLVECVRDAAEEVQAERILELFCGVGNFSFPLGEVADALMGIERSDVAVEMAETMAEFTRREELAFLEADLSEGLDHVELVEEFPCDTVVVDPPRGGAAEVCRDLVDRDVEQIIYVSCDPGALGRDLEILTDGSWRTVWLEMFDMFPRTAHIETVAHLESAT
jgi:23S rRNA (uracil1939-C5)-methyltransferase